MLKVIKRNFENLFVDPGMRRFIDFNVARWGNALVRPAKAEVLIELYPVRSTVIAFSYFANLLAGEHNAKLVSFSTSFRNAFLNRNRLRNFFKLYQSFNVVDLVTTNKKCHVDAVEKTYAAIISTLASKNDLLDIQVDDCPIGGDIYESYLATYFKPTVEVQSPMFRRHLYDCLAIYFFWKEYLKTHYVKAMIMSHGIYQYGILVKIANKNGIPVYLPNLRAMNCLRKFGEMGNPEFNRYPEIFRKLPPDMQENGKRWAKQQLQRRLSGEIGVDMHYSSKSSFNRRNYSGKVLRESSNLKVVILSHCFFDNPNAYGKNLFPDFHEWLSFLGEMSNKTGYDWYLKTHPDVLPGNEPIINEFLAKYPKITRVPSAVSHHQLVEEGVKTVLTVYGSAGHECPLLGQNVVNAGMNPHIAYHFNLHPKTIEEYTNILMNLDRVKIDVVPEEIYEFYFVHYKLNVSQKLYFRSYSDFISRLGVSGEFTSNVFDQFIGEYSTEKDASTCSKIREFIKSGEYKYFEDVNDIDF